MFYVDRRSISSYKAKYVKTVQKSSPSEGIYGPNTQLNSQPKVLIFGMSKTNILVDYATGL